MQSSTHPPRRRRAVMLALATLAAATVTVTAGTASADAGPSDEPAAKGPAAVHGQRGKLLGVRPLSGTAALPSAARNLLVTYVSEDGKGKRIAVSGTVSLPKKRPPAGGWPVISWAHGTTGTADACAPSADTATGLVHDYLSLMDKTRDAWVARGFAVVQTDYEGLGTPGEHPYMNGRSAANTVLDMVRAARNVDHRVGKGWFAIGHSQGGHAALFSAAAENTRKDVKLLGAVAIAPGGVGLSQTAPYIQAGGPGAQAALAFLPTLLIGASAADPAVVPDALLTAEAKPLLTAGRTSCLAQIREVAATIPVNNVFAPGADLGPLTRYLQTQDPTGIAVRVPTLVAQGTDDALVPKQTTDHLISTMCAKAKKVSYKVYSGADHRAAVAASFDDALNFVNTVRSGGTPATTC
ncbi:alpha/beta hydrolase family protein [Streptosporangium carneum]|uniref:Lipase n=1 Tax=Streptosporangium carneum TaxID=47481 RepID=A0A9W6I0G5_9ACTN|nr:lipase family protein [Streptosporangium carneum]GLK08764.1 lipase [Streptosporangium carneum]